ncbi:hypothetical protein [Pseudomonas coronafaciens]|uniref:Uncharacterized protein n=1 Tax=Pseudomonas coronafaciens pv. striafaciens TaxID=235276 RepID=A0A3M4YC77_9PSED|nr:hypothetical protein [Pseudomonas coronafaciens]RMR86254.1 hypothetical protein ALP78_102332 [Pseudomonas coronafaciens pv. striafaciens]
MNYTVYPPQEIDKVITAKAAITHLGDHFQAFLNANNISSWAPADDYTLRDDRVADILVCLGTSKGMSIAQIKYRAKKLMKVVKASGGTMKLNFAYNVVANCLGYSAFQFANRCRSVDHYVENLWPLGMVNNGSLFEEMKKEHWPSSSVSMRMRENIELNKFRDGIFKEIKRKGKKERSQKEVDFLKVRSNALTRRATMPIETRD